MGNRRALGRKVPSLRGLFRRKFGKAGGKGRSRTPPPNPSDYGQRPAADQQQQRQRLDPADLGGSGGKDMTDTPTAAGQVSVSSPTAAVASSSAKEAEAEASTPSTASGSPSAASEDKLSSPPTLLGQMYGLYDSALNSVGNVCGMSGPALTDPEAADPAEAAEAAAASPEASQRPAPATWGVPPGSDDEDSAKEKKTGHDDIELILENAAGGGASPPAERDLKSSLDAAETEAVVNATRQNLLKHREESKLKQAQAGGGEGGQQEEELDLVDPSVAAALETWRSATDPSTGRTYYYNRVTKETKWDPPPELVDAYRTVVAKKAAMVGAAVSSSPETSPAGTPRSAAGASPMSSIKKAMQNTALARGISKKMKKKSGSGSGAAAGSPASASGATSKKAAPKPMWRATKDKTSGNTYYYHTGTKETSWIKPSEYDEKADKRMARRNKKKGKKSARKKVKKPEWKSAEAESGKTYYYHTKTKEVSWKKPEGFDEDMERYNREKDAARRATIAFDPIIIELQQALARTLPGEEAAPQREQLMATYMGREEDLVAGLVELRDETPFDEVVEEPAIHAKMEQIKARGGKPATPAGNAVAGGVLSTSPDEPYRSNTRTLSVMTGAVTLPANNTTPRGDIDMGAINEDGGAVDRSPPPYPAGSPYAVEHDDDSVSVLSVASVEYAGMRSRLARKKRIALEDAVEAKDWEKAAIYANDLSADHFQNKSVSPCSSLPSLLPSVAQAHH